MRYRPTTMDELRACLGACPAEMPVEAERCVPVDSQTVAELHSLSAWPPGTDGASLGWSGFDLAVLFEEEPDGYAALSAPVTSS